MRGKSSTTLNLARKKDDDDDVFLNNNNALSFIKPSSFLTNDDCVFRERQSRYSNQRSIFGARVERTGKSFETRDGRKRAQAHIIVVVFCVYFGRDVTQHSLVWIGRARVCTRTRSIKKRSYCRRLSTSLTGTFLSSFFVKK